MRIRIKFRKNGVMRFVGHLDIMRYFQKAIRRAGIDIRYTEGFSPHQIMSFAAPLGIGITSDGEYMDIDVNSTRSSEESLQALNAVMVEGMEISSYVALREGAKKAMTAVAAADYIVYFKKTVEFSEEEIREMIAEYFDNREKIEITKQTKKSERVVDVKPLTYQFRPFCDVSERKGFFLQLCTGSAENIKPELVLKDFYDYFGKDYDPYNLQIHRLEVYENVNGKLLPLEAAGDVIL
ncbi:MAG: TIGR03936 family radical SAM-associated protein [Clostridiales bacterium]|nr:TIGR03936 family radical SAM-associated protein [Clostridiales bacterium]